MILMTIKEADGILEHHDIHPDDWGDVGDYKAAAYSIVAMYITDKDKSISRHDVYSNNHFMGASEAEKFDQSLDAFWKECKE